MSRIFLFLFLCLSARAQVKPSFTRDVAPLLLEKCLQCHGSEQQKGKYRLDTFDHLLHPGKSVKNPIVQGDPESSYLFTLLTHADPDERMPQKNGALSAEQIDLIGDWIRQGGYFDGPDKSASINSYVEFKTKVAPTVYPQRIPILSIAFSRNGNSLFTAGYHELVEWGVTNQALLRRLPGLPERIQSLTMHPTLDRLYFVGGTPGRSGVLGWVDLSTGAVRMIHHTPDVLLGVSCSSDGLWLACGGTDGTLRVFELESGALKKTIPLHADWVTSLAFSPDGKWLVSSSRDRTARALRVPAFELESTFVGHEAPVYDLQFVSEKQRVASSGADHKLRVWNLENAKEEFSVESGDSVRVLGIGSSIFLASINGVISKVQWKERKITATFVQSRQRIHALAQSRTQPWLASGLQDGMVELWNTETGKLESSWLALPLTAR